jgi:putative endonuclease
VWTNRLGFLRDDKKALIILFLHHFLLILIKKIAMMIEYTEGIYNFYVYILTNKNKTVLYTGVTNSLKRRLPEHRDKLNPKSFTAKYNVEFLVYYEHFTWIQLAIAREKEIKNLLREKKLDLIKEFNPEFEFLNSHFE